MTDYRVVLSRPAERDLDAVPAALHPRLVKAIDDLAINPRPRGVRKLRGAKDLWRIRLAEYRIIYRIDDARRLIDISHVRHRKDAYR
ncbi:MAG: type II toxin-antitoxin system RelE/ParE family toxin [Deltaproteobacteria bacterium]|nr:type II toxin-antitoxin system RelE/ParE family toxin [Deltaproteobacteria bacterium]